MQSQLAHCQPENSIQSHRHQGQIHSNQTLLPTLQFQTTLPKGTKTSQTSSVHPINQLHPCSHSIPTGIQHQSILRCQPHAQVRQICRRRTLCPPSNHSLHCGTPQIVCSFSSTQDLPTSQSTHSQIKSQPYHPISLYPHLQTRLTKINPGFHPQSTMPSSTHTHPQGPRSTSPQSLQPPLQFQIMAPQICTQITHVMPLLIIQAHNPQPLFHQRTHRMPHSSPPTRPKYFVQM